MLQIDIDRDRSPWRITLKGSINEESVFSKIDCSSQQRVEIALDKLTGMNSVGIQVWNAWMTGLNPETTYVFLRTPPFFNYFVGTVRGMLPPRRELGSFLVPYISGADCELIEYLFGKEFNDREFQILEKLTSPVTHHVLEIDVIPEQYFSFLKEFYPKISGAIRPEFR